MSRQEKGDLLIQVISDCLIEVTAFARLTVFTHFQVRIKAYKIVNKAQKKIYVCLRLPDRP
jgi:hypothetical protein